MKNLIVYMSRHGTTRKVAHELKEKLGSQNTMLVDLADSPAPGLAQFDTVIIGGSIHAGKIQADVRRFCDEHMKTLLTKHIGLFLCFMDKTHGQQEFDSAFPAELREHSSANGLFGGELLFEEMNFFERMIMKTMSGEKQSVSALDQDAIGRFGRTMHE